MERLNPEKLYVEYRSGVTPIEPIIGRKYTLTHSDVTANLFLNIGLEYAYDKINTMRDEVLAEWRIYNGAPILYGFVHIDGQFATNTSSALRDAVFRRELPLALEAIRYGDRGFFAAYNELDNAPIWIHFYSANPYYNRLENWGSPKDYK